MVARALIDRYNYASEKYVFLLSLLREDSGNLSLSGLREYKLSQKKVLQNSSVMIIELIRGVIPSIS